MNRFLIAKFVGAVTSILFLPSGLLLLVGDTDPGGQRHTPDLLHGGIALIIGALGLAVYALGQWKAEPQQRSIQQRLIWYLLIGIPVLIGVALLFKD